MLNEKLSDYDILPRANISRAKTFPEVKLVDFCKGSIVFEKPACSELMTIDSFEKILTLFRKVDTEIQTACIQSLQISLNQSVTMRCVR